MKEYYDKGYKWFYCKDGDIIYFKEVEAYTSDTYFKKGQEYLVSYKDPNAYNYIEGKLYALTKTYFQAIQAKLALQLKFLGKAIHSQWQARDTVEMVEVFNQFLTLNVPIQKEIWAKEIDPNLPWAEDHFLERVSGIPMNPAPSYEWWPYYKDDEKWKIDGKFSHTYPERMNTPDIMGIRYHYGNLHDVITMLQKNPNTRQAYLPIWFPEDTGAVHGESVPCSLGYQFYIRDGQLNCYYSMRSCDFRRHFKNDVYMAGRLMQFVANSVKVRPGQLHMHIMNLHVFKGEENVIL